MKTIIVFLIIFSIIVVIHELGHYLMAKRAGILVREFAIGMGPKIFSAQDKSGTSYTLRMLPLGGYVRLAGLGEEDEIQAGMEVGLEIDSNDQVSVINMSDNISTKELPIRVDKIDLIYDMYIDGIPVGSSDLVRYSVSKQAQIIEEDGTKIPVAPIESRYESASVWHKMLTNFAGPFNNFILSILAFIITAFMIGIPQNVNLVGTVVEGSAADQAGIIAGDRVLSIDDQAIGNWEELVMTLRGKPGQEIDMVIEREGQTLDKSFTVTSVEDTETGESYGQIGIGIYRQSSLWDNIKYGFTATWAVITGVVGVIISMVQNGFNINNFGGPIAIAQLTGDVVDSGLPVIINFLASLSANLGIFNLLPIPALDGGKIILNLIEAVRGKPLSESKEGIITIIGVIIMVILMVAVTWNDINRAFF